jgi:hypothetical protein
MSNIWLTLSRCKHSTCVSRWPSNNRYRPHGPGVSQASCREQDYYCWCSAAYARPAEPGTSAWLASLAASDSTSLSQPAVQLQPQQGALPPSQVHARVIVDVPQAARKLQLIAVREMLPFCMCSLQMHDQVFPDCTSKHDPAGPSCMDAMLSQALPPLAQQLPSHSQHHAASLSFSHQPPPLPQPLPQSLPTRPASQQLFDKPRMLQVGFSNQAAENRRWHACVVGAPQPAALR